GNQDQAHPTWPASPHHDRRLPEPDARRRGGQLCAWQRVYLQPASGRQCDREFRPRRSAGTRQDPVCRQSVARPPRPRPVRASRDRTGKRLMTTFIPHTPVRDRPEAGALLLAGIMLAALTEAIASTILLLGRGDMIGDTHATPD